MHTPLETSWHAAGARASIRDTPAVANGRDGSTVVIKDGLSLLTDAAEEIGLHLSGRIERRDHGQRRVAPGRSGRRLTIEEINAYLEKSRQAPDAESRLARIKEILHRIQQPQETLALQPDSAQTPTDHYLLLQQALQAALAEGLPAVAIERLEQGLADVEAASGLQVFADLATIDQASSFGDTAQAVASFQTSVHAILGKPTLVQALREALALAEKDGQKLDRAVLHLIDAVGTCLYALGTTREQVLLRTLVTDLFHLKCLNTMFTQARFVMRSVRKTLRQGTAAGESGHVTAT